jgi:hypothetical protein
LEGWLLSGSGNQIGMEERMSKEMRFCFQVFTVCIFWLGFFAGWFAKGVV